MREVYKMMIGALLILLMTAATWPGDSDVKVKGKHRRMVEEAAFFYSVDDHFMAQRIYADLVDLYPDNEVFNFRLGYSYLHLRNEEQQSIPYLEKSARMGHTPAYFYLAEAYHMEERFEEALTALANYRQRDDHQLSHARIDMAEERSLRAKAMIAAPEKAVVTRLGSNINTDHQEYAPNIDPEGNKLYFTSRRPGGTGDYTDVEGSYFEDIYVAQRLAGAWTASKSIKGPINSDGHDANVNLTSSGNRLIIYRTHKNLFTGDLYYSDIRRDGWTEPIKFGSNINTDKYHEPSAALSPDEREMYIASDRPGGYGGKDLYVLRRLPNGEWSEPQNMGRRVNSPMDEDAPFLSLDGRTLYFASTGHNSIGGYDIFRTSTDALGEWELPEQLGYPINSVSDDIYFSTTADGKKGYLSSSRAKSMDIYEIDMLYEDDDLVVVKGFVTEEVSGLPMSAEVTFADRNGRVNTVRTLTNNQSGRYVVALLPDVKYELRVDALGYERHTENVVVEVSEKGMFRVIERDVTMGTLKTSGR